MNYSREELKVQAQTIYDAFDKKTPTELVYLTKLEENALRLARMILHPDDDRSIMAALELCKQWEMSDDDLERLLGG